MAETRFDLIVIGGGAAGFYGAIQAAEKKPDMRILILEKSSKLLSKVRVSGGGRCNVTNHCFEPIALSHHYPRGEKTLKSIFKKYHAHDTVDWFESKGVQLKTEADQRMFPSTNNSETIIDCFIQQAQKHAIKIETNKAVQNISPSEHSLEVICQNGESYFGEQVLVAIGGHPNPGAYQFIADLGHQILKPIPSLFTFNDSQNQFKELMGVAVANAEIKITGTKFSQQGPVLITHWGLSGPAVIKLSAWAAEYLHQVNYEFTALVSWVGPIKEDEFKKQLQFEKEKRNKQKVISNPLFGLPIRLWSQLCLMSQIEEQKIWAELPQKNTNRLMEFLIRCPFTIKGKTTFKEEFVTCGGVDLKEIDTETMESKKVKNLFFAGEVLNIDGETGGFNFQAAWSMAFVASTAIVSRK